MPTKPSKHLETFDNPRADRDYTIEITMPEFTCLCPKTGQPDFATLYLDYVPDRKCVELKSLKLYVWSFRNEGHFHEDVTNAILSDLVTATAPRYMRLRAEFYVRGGIYTTVTADHRQPGWREPAPPPETDPALTERVEIGREPEPDATPTPSPSRGRLGTASGGTGRFRMLPRAARTEATATESKTRASPSKPTAARRAPAPEPPREPVYVGVDLGTSGCRIVAIDAGGQLLAQVESPIPLPVRSNHQVTQDAGVWWKALSAGLENLLKQVPAARVATLAVDGTSGTLLLCDRNGAPTTPAMMYNDGRAVTQAEKILAVAARNCGAHGASSSLAKLLWLQDKGMDKKAAHALHQADWITGRLSGQWGHSDYNNCLKLGYDVQELGWPDWLARLGVNTALLPKVHAPGDVVGTVGADIAKAFGLRADTQVLAGTTDGVASFLAAGATEPGHAVTALGSTLVLKLLSDKAVFAPEYGVYSHRLANRWLVGGASNSGGAALLQYFKAEQMRDMTPLLDPEHLTGLEYYPLPNIGERFPINDPDMVAILEPLPGDSVTFFQGMLEGIAGIEAQGYRLLHKLGAPKVVEIRTTGGGSQNLPWQRIRERIVDVPMKKARSDLAAYGTALLAAGLVSRAMA